MVYVINNVFKRKLVILLLTLLSVSVSAQQEPSFSHYWAMEPSCYARGSGLMWLAAPGVPVAIQIYTFQPILGLIV